MGVAHRIVVAWLSSRKIALCFTNRASFPATSLGFSVSTEPQGHASPDSAMAPKTWFLMAWRRRFHSISRARPF